MQKKYIIPVLMAVPTAMPMMADIAMPDNYQPVLDKWSSVGTSGDLNTFDPANNSFTSVSGISQVSQELKNLPQGKYTLTFNPSGTHTFNIKVTIDVDGTIFEPKKDLVVGTSLGYSFEVTDEKAESVKITIAAENQQSLFGFADARLMLAFDFDKAAEALGAQLTAVGDIVKITKDVAEYISPEYSQGLTNTQESLTKELTGIQNDLEKLTVFGKETTLTPEALEFYMTKELWKDESDYTEDLIHNAIDTFSKEVKAHNPKAEVANANAAILKELDSKEIHLGEKEAECKTALGEEGYAFEQNNATYLDYVSKIDVWEKQVDALKAEALKGVAISDIPVSEEDKTPLYESLYTQASDKQTGYWHGLEKLIEKINADKADEAAYNEYVTAAKKFEDDYNAQLTAIDKLSGVDGMTTNFAENQAKARTEILNLKEEGLKESGINIKNKEIAGAKAKLENALAVLKDYTQRIQAVVVALAKDITDTNEEYNAALDKITGKEGLQTALNDVKESIFNEEGKSKLPEAFQGQFDEEVKKIQDAIDALTNELKEAYTAQELPVANFETKVSDIQTEIGNLSKKCGDDGFYGKVIAFTNDLDEVWATINENNTGEFLIVVSKLQTTHDNIANSINKLDPNANTYNSDIKAIATGIENLGNTAEQLHLAIETYTTDIAKAKEAIEGLYALLDQTDLIDLSGTYIANFRTTLTQDGGLKSNYDAIVAKYKDATTDPTVVDQAFYETVAAINAELSGADFANKVKVKEQEFRQGLTGSNWKALEEVNKYELSQDVNKETINKLFQAAEQAKNAAIAGTATYSPENCQKADEAIQAAYDARLWANNSDEAYKTSGYADKFNDQNTVLAEARTYNEATAKQPAQDYFATTVIGNVDNPAEESLQGRLDALENAIDEAHKNSAMLEEVDGVSNNTKFQEELQKLIIEISSVETEILNNETAHNGQLAINKTIQEQIASYLVQILGDEEKGIEPTFDPELTHGMAEQITDIRDGDLNKLNRAVAEAYATGKSAVGGTDENNDFIRQYADIKAELDGIWKKFEGDYNAAVITVNTDLTNAVWTPLFNFCYETYTSSIKTYNDYIDLKNADYKKFINTTLKDHEGLFEYFGKITDLNQKVQKMLSDANEAHRVLELKDFAGSNLTDGEDYDDPTTSENPAVRNSIISTAHSLVKEMNQAVRNLSGDINGKAKEYFVVLNQKADNLFKANTETMQAAGFDEASINDALADARGIRKDATDAYDKYTEGTTMATAPESAVEETLGYAMNGIADKFDSLTTAIDLQEAAVIYWGNENGAVVRQILIDIEDVKSLKGVTSDKKQPVLDALNEGLIDVLNLNSEVSLIQSNLIAVVKEYKERLDAIRDELSEQVKAIKAADEANIAEQNAIALLRLAINNLELEAEKFYDFLCPKDKETETLHPLACASDKEVIKAKNLFEGLIANLKKYLTDEQYAGKVAALMEDDSAIEAVQNAIKEAYKTAEAQEVEILKALRSKVRIAFNNAADSPNCPPGIASINGALTGFFNEIDALPTDGTDPVAFTSKALNLEVILSDWLVKLQSYDTDHGNTLETIKNDLESLYTRVDQAIKSGMNGVVTPLSPAQIEDFQKKYHDLSEDLQKIKNALEGAGNMVITQADNFKAAITAIETSLGTLNSEVQDAIDAAQKQADLIIENQQNLTALNAEIEKIDGGLKEFKTRLETYGYTDTYAEEIEKIELRIADFQTAINTAFQGNDLTGETYKDFVTESRNISTYILTLEIYTAKHHVAVAEHGADQAILAAWRALNPTDGTAIVPEMLKEAKATLSSLRWTNNEYDGRVDNWMENYGLAFETFPADIREKLNDLDTYADAFNEIAEAAKSVETDAADNKYIPGDVNDDKKVNFLDIQQVLNWVMAVTDIEELSPRVGAAADVNQDNLLNITDVTAIINLVMGENESQVRAAMGRRMVESNNTIYPELVSAENGVRRFAISLANSEVFANGQFDLKLAPGMMIESVTIGERVKGHEVLSQDHGDITRVAVVSMENAAIQGTDGAVVYVEVSGEGNIAIENAVFATPKAVGHVISNGETSAIDKVIEGARDLKERIYNAAGQQLDRVQRGINIIRKSDGTVTKELRK